MFFSGDPSNRKRVDLGGRSSKERDRKKLLEQAKLERNKRSQQRQQNSAALTIQVHNNHTSHIHTHTDIYNLHISIRYEDVYSIYMCSYVKRG